MSGRGRGYHSLWGWFGFTRASFCVLPRVLMHDMPDRWQADMAKLLQEFDGAYPNADIGTRVLRERAGKLVKWDSWMLNYRHPDNEELDRCRRR